MEFYVTTNSSTYEDEFEEHMEVSKHFSSIPFVLSFFNYLIQSPLMFQDHVFLNLNQ
jgi:hypothetical protein